MVFLLHPPTLLSPLSLLRSDHAAATPDGGQQGRAEGHGGRHVGGRRCPGGAGVDGVALVGGAALARHSVAGGQDGAGRRGVAAGVVQAALNVEAREVGDGGEDSLSSVAALVPSAGLLGLGDAMAHQAYGALVAGQRVHQVDGGDKCKQSKKQGLHSLIGRLVSLLAGEINAMCNGENSSLWC